jgi:hypothetical protein
MRLSSHFHSGNIGWNFGNLGCSVILFYSSRAAAEFISG